MKCCGPEMDPPQNSGSSLRFVFYSPHMDASSQCPSSFFCQCGSPPEPDDGLNVPKATS